MSLSVRLGRSSRRPWRVREVISTSAPPSGMNRSVRAMSQRTGNGVSSRAFDVIPRKGWHLGRVGRRRLSEHLEDAVQPVLRQAEEAEPGGRGERPLREPLANPVAGLVELPLRQPDAVLDRPAPVVALVKADRRREDERQPEGSVEGELGRLGPQDVGVRQPALEAQEIALEALLAEDLDAALAVLVARGEPGLAGPGGEALRDLRPHAGDQTEPQPALTDRRRE